jgi:succinoglycan biosynthesis protein ExoH
MQVSATSESLASTDAGAVAPRSLTLDSAKLSETISFARILLIVGLVFLHYGSFPNSTVSPFHGLDPQAHQVATFVNSFVLFSMFSVVPLLSMISGWLFFSFKENAIVALVRRIGRRFKSLYLPLVCWNAFFLLVLVAIYFVDPRNALLAEINVPIGNASLGQYVNSVFALTEHPVGFQFWFVRDLFVTALVSPLLLLMMVRAPRLGFFVLGASWLMGFDLWIFFRSDVVFFFYLGGLVRLYALPLNITLRTTLVLFTLYIGLTALRALAPLWVDFTVVWQDSLIDIATRSIRLVGALACWGLFLSLASTTIGSYVARLGGLAFFVHAAHYPLLAALKIVFWKGMAQESDAVMLLHYLVTVTATVTICIGLGLALARWWPSFFALMNGGRLLAKESQSARALA